MNSTAPLCHRVAASLTLVVCLVMSPAVQSRGRTGGGTRPPDKHAADIRLPRGYRVLPAQSKRFNGNGIRADLFAGEFSQGKAAYIELYADQSAGGKDLVVRRLMLENVQFPLSETGWGYRAVLAFSPETTPGTKKLKIEYSTNGVPRSEEFSFQINKGDFLYSRRALDLGNYSDVDYRLTPEELSFIERCAARKKKVFGTASPDGLIGSFSHPRDEHYVTSPFWAKRHVMRYRKKNGRTIRFPDRVNVHKGIDLRGRAGDPVYALAGGRVAISEPMYYEGNFVVIDHGNRIFSFYMHLEETGVKEGAAVRAGERIGRVGSTGLSTAPHLHVSLMIQDIYVDPLSFILLPIRD